MSELRRKLVIVGDGACGTSFFRLSYPYILPIHPLRAALEYLSHPSPACVLRFAR